MFALTRVFVWIALDPWEKKTKSALHAHPFSQIQPLIMAFSVQIMTWTVDFVTMHVQKAQNYVSQIYVEEGITIELLVYGPVI